MRTYGEVISIRTGSAGADSSGAGSAGGVAVGNQFLWRSRIYVVRNVLAHWVESGTWWTSLQRQSKLRALPSGSVDGVPVEASTTERWVWRVEAAAGSSAPIGVYDVACEIRGADSAELAQGQWRLARALD